MKGLMSQCLVICADFSCAVCQAAGHRRRYMLDSVAANAEGIYTVCLTFFSLISSLNSVSFYDH